MQFKIQLQHSQKTLLKSTVYILKNTFLRAYFQKHFLPPSTIDFQDFFRLPSFHITLN